VQGVIRFLLKAIDPDLIEFAHHAMSEVVAEIVHFTDANWNFGLILIVDHLADGIRHVISEDVLTRLLLFLFLDLVFIYSP
jgi:hypothetical protein